MTNDFSGGLRGLRPPATFLATLRVAEVSQLYTGLCGPWLMIRWSRRAALQLAETRIWRESE